MNDSNISVRALYICLRCALGALVGICLPLTAPLAQGTGVIIRPWLLTDSSLAKVYSALINPVDSSRWRAIVVPESQSLIKLVYDSLGVGETHRRIAGQTIREIVSVFNQIRSDAILRRGQLVYLPEVPRYVESPGPAAKMLGMQIMGVSRVASTSVSGKTVSPAAAPIWKVDFPDSSSVSLAGFLGELRSLGNNPIWRVVIPENALVEGHPFLSEPLVAADSVELLHLPPTLAPHSSARAASPSTRVGTLFVLDFFGPTETHGCEVMDVVNETLSDMGLPEMQSFVVKFDLDLRVTPTEKRKIVKRWLESLPADKKLAADVLADFDADTVAAMRGGPVVSVRYFTAILDSIQRARGARIVTSAFAVESPLVGMFAASFQVADRDSLILFSASGNENREFESVVNWTARQPHKAIFDMTGRQPLFMVGGELKAGKPFGVWSRRPWIVPWIGRAAGWRGNCAKDLKGTSYAAPHLAASLFGAIHHWSAARTPWKDRETVIQRLLVAAVPRAALAGRYAAAGPPSYEKLLLKPGSFVRPVGEALQSVAGTITGTLTLLGPDGPNAMTIGTRSGNEAWALSYDGLTALVLRRQDRSWLGGNVVSVDITIPAIIVGCTPPGDTVCRITTPAQLSRHVAELGIFP